MVQCRTLKGIRGRVEGLVRKDLFIFYFKGLFFMLFKLMEALKLK